MEEFKIEKTNKWEAVNNAVGMCLGWLKYNSCVMKITKT